MAMTRNLYTINALATELGRDRRTVAKALASTPPDGKSGQWPAWHLSTAMGVLSASDRPVGDKFAAVLRSRIDDADAISKPIGDGGTCSLWEFARATGLDAATALLWLKAGMPFTTEGDWQTGEGFRLRFVWAADWTVMAGAVLRNQDDGVAAKALRL